MVSELSACGDCAGLSGYPVSQTNSPATRLQWSSPEWSKPKRNTSQSQTQSTWETSQRRIGLRRMCLSSSGSSVDKKNPIESRQWGKNANLLQIKFYWLVYFHPENNGTFWFWPQNEPNYNGGFLKFCSWTSIKLVK